MRNKLILIEDLDGADQVLYPLREIKSKKRITKTVVIKNTKGETRTITLKVEGPVCVADCTTKESPSYSIFAMLNQYHSIFNLVLSQLIEVII